MGQTAECFRRQLVGQLLGLAGDARRPVRSALSNAPACWNSAADLGEHRRRCFAFGDQLLQLPAIVVLQAFERQRPQHGRPAAQHVAAQRELVEVVALPILQVVENLERDAQVPGQLCDRLCVLFGRSGQAQAAIQRGLERRRRLERVDLQRFGGRQAFVAAVAPHQLRALAFAELRVRIRPAC